MSDEIARIKQLFQAAAELPSDERSAWLDRQRAAPEIRAKVEEQLELLGCDTLDLPQPMLGRDTPDEAAPSVMFGRYKLLRSIGEGGFGSVWLAEQQQPVRREVALKIIKVGMDTAQVVARFEAERQTLALMDHPSIARVLDAGATPGGRPYFVMDLVKGTAITEFCDAAELDTRARLELFCQVCLAVHHAHQKGVIHRDLKPSNILVTRADGQPLPKVIDFGIAKATSAELTKQTVFTEFRQVVGTPGYMSPEQADLSAFDVDTRADIYSLGVLLYELMTGTLPLDMERLAGGGYVEMLRAIREHEPPKPSTRISMLGDSLEGIASRRHSTPQGLGRTLRGDLDWIIMRALEKDRTRRYGSAAEFAADVDRYLRHEPVHATPPSAAYRLRKFVRRHRVRVAFAATLIVAAVAVGAGASWVLLDSAARRRTLTRDVSAVLGETRLRTNDRAWQAAREALERARGMVDSPDATPALRDSVAAVARRLEEREAEDRAQRDKESAQLRFMERLDGIRSAEAASFESIRLDSRPTWVMRARLYREAFAELGVRPDTETDPAAVAALRDSEHVVQLALALDQWAGVCEVLGQGETASRLLRLATAIDDEVWRTKVRVARLSGDGAALVALSGESEVRESPATATALAEALRRTGQPDRELELLRSAWREDPQDYGLLEALARALESRGELSEALRYRTAAVALRPGSATANQCLARTLANLGEETVEEAIRCYQRAIAIDDGQPGAHFALALLLDGVGRPEAAQVHYRQVADQYELLVGSGRRTTDILYGLAAALEHLGRNDEAIAWLRETLVEDPDSSDVHQDLGTELCEKARKQRDGALLAEAIQHLRRAIELDARSFRSHYNLAVALQQRRDFPGAVDCFRRAIELLDGGFRSRRMAPGVFSNLGTNLAMLGNHEESIPWFRKAIEARPDYIEALAGLASSLKNIGAFDEAAEVCDRAIAAALAQGKEQLAGRLGPLRDYIVDQQARANAK